jgi:hypothetical protein
VLGSYKSGLEFHAYLDNLAPGDAEIIALKIGALGPGQLCFYRRHEEIADGQRGKHDDPKLLHMNLHLI